jgi:hypothetical protein
VIHSKFGASGFHRLIACHGVIRQARDCCDSSNDAAELGTAAHECGEFALKMGVNAFELLDLKFNGHTVDAAMSDAVQLYVAFIRNLAQQFNTKPMLENRVIMSSVRDDVFGTSDCIFIIGDTLHVYDYKHGYVVVEVENNSQAIFYAVAALDTYQLWDKIKHIRTGIIQPRADHIDGSIRTADYTMQDMREWQNTFRETVIAASDQNAPLNAGEHCRYCLASAFCRPRIERTIKLAYGEKPIETLNEDEIITMFKEVPIIRRNLERIELRALELARDGKEIKDFKLVRTITRAKCNEEKEFVEAVTESGDISKEKLYNQKLKSMTDCKKIIDHGLVNKYFVKPPPSTTLVKMTDKRPAISSRPSAIGKFNQVERPSATGKFKNRTE